MNLTDAQRIASIHSALAIHQSMEVRREEYLDHMTFQANRRPLFTEIFGPLVGLKEEWAAQGATPAELDLSAFRYRRAQNGNIPVITGWLGSTDWVILEETEEYILARDPMNRLSKLLKRAATLPLPLEYPVKTCSDWQKIKHHYQFSEERFLPGWEAEARQHLADGRVVTVTIPGGFDEPRELMGDAALCEAYYTQPMLVRDILETLAETAYQVLERVSAQVTVDQLSVHEDMAGKSGPLIGPRQVKEFIHPYYRPIWDMLHARGARLFSMDSDGDMTPLLPSLIETGINTLYPIEPAAGMDMVRVRQAYGSRLAMLGGIDKHVLRRSKAEIKAELEYKIPPMVQSGGCVLALDHRIPNGTPLEHYRYYIDTAWKIMAREAARL
jgi:hypothetical protein